MRTHAFAAVAVVVALGIGGVAFATGFGPAPGGAEAGGDDIDDFPTATDDGGDADGSRDGSDGTSESSDDGGDSGSATGSDDPPLAFEVASIETCGSTCRDVTLALHNERDDPATDVEVYARIFPGNDTDGDPAWQGTESVGTLDAGAEYTATRRVELSYAEGLAVRDAGGWVTIQTTIETADRTVTYTTRRNVQ